MQIRSKHHPLTTDKDISSQAFWGQTFLERDETFAWLRQNAPVSWHLPLELPELPPEVHGEAGFWALVRSEEVAYASQNYQLFSSDQSKYGVGSVRPQLARPGAKPTFIAMDPPQQTRYRQVFSRHFTPKGVAKMRDAIEGRATEIVDRVVGAGDIDFVKEVSARLPMQTIADLVGVPDSLIEPFAQAGDNFVGARDPEISGGENPLTFMVKQMGVLREIGVDLVAHRRKHPADDLATAIAEAEIDGKPLDDDDVENLMLLLSVAGNDTTKQTTSHSVINLWAAPEQRSWLSEDYDGRIDQAIAEFIRWATPVMNFARTATEDVELAGQKIEAGDKVALFYCSANRDESLFSDAHRFDITRQIATHSGFGGGGVHYCLGNMVAKAQLRALFGQFLTRLPDMEVGQPEYLRSDFLHGVRSLPVRIS